MKLMDERIDETGAPRLSEVGTGGVFPVPLVGRKDPETLAKTEERKRQDIAHTKRHLMSMPSKDRCSLVVSRSRLVPGHSQHYASHAGNGSFAHSTASRDSDESRVPR